MARPGRPVFPTLPSPPLPSRRPPTAAPLEARRGVATRLDSITGRVYSIEGTFRLEGAGEALIDVTFPVWFIERPFPGFGAEMAPNQVLVAGKYPTVSVVVHRWRMKDYPHGVSYYAGATLVVVSGGAEGQTMLVHWSMTAKALRNPSGETLTTDAAI